MLAQGPKASEVCRGLGISDRTYYRWKKEYGGMRTDQAKRLKEFEKENARLKRWLADVSAGSPGNPLPAAGADEGSRLLQRHYRIERSRWIVKEKKRQFHEEHRRLFCEVCRTDFSAVYGELWNETAIEAHHVKPLSKLAKPSRTQLADLVLVCATCHRLIHQTENADENLERLREQLQ